MNMISHLKAWMDSVSHWYPLWLPYSVIMHLPSSTSTSHPPGKTINLFSSQPFDITFWSTIHQPFSGFRTSCHDSLLIIKLSLQPMFSNNLCTPHSILPHRKRFWISHKKYLSILQPRPWILVSKTYTHDETVFSFISWETPLFLLFG